MPSTPLSDGCEMNHKQHIEQIRKKHRRNEFIAHAAITGFFSVPVGLVLHYSFWVEDGRPEVTFLKLCGIAIQVMVVWAFLYGLVTKDL